MATSKQSGATRNAGMFALAQMEESLVEMYKGNPFIESLGPIHDDMGAFNAMLNVPMMGANQKQRNPIVRLHELMQMLNICIPMSRNIELYHRVSVLLRYGYVGRPTTSQEFVQWIQEPLEIDSADGGAGRLSRLNSGNQRKGSAVAFSVIGPSGTGKSSGIANAFNGVPLVQYHEELNAIQISRLIVTCPEDGRIKGLLFRIIDAFDVVLSENFSKQTRKYTTEGLIIFVAQMCRVYNVGMIVIDEFNNLSAAGSKTNEVNYIINFLVDLMEVVHVPLVIVGNDSCRQFISAQLRSAKRLAGLGDFDWGFLNTEPDEIDSSISESMDASANPPKSEYEEFVSTFLAFQMTDEQATYDELAADLYEETGGMHDLIIKKMIIAQGEALRRGMPKVTPALLRAVSKRDFAIFADLLKAIKQKDVAALENVPDLKAHFEERMAVLQSSFSDRNTTQRIQDAIRTQQAGLGEVIDRVTDILFIAGKPVDLARSVVTRIVQARPAIQIDEALKLALKEFEPARIPGPKRAKAEPAGEVGPSGVEEMDDDDLRKIVFTREEGASAYDALVAARAVWSSYCLTLLAPQ